MASDLPAYPGPDHPMLGAQLRLASEAVHAAIYARLHDAGHPDLRPTHFALLVFPGPRHTRPVELAARVGLSKQALNPLLNELEQMGYLQRVPDDRDRRGRILQLTTRGMALMATLRAILDDLEQHLTDRVGAADIDTFYRVLNELGAVTAHARLARAATDPVAARNRVDRPARAAHAP